MLKRRHKAATNQHATTPETHTHTRLAYVYGIDQQDALNKLLARHNSNPSPHTSHVHTNPQHIFTYRCNIVLQNVLCKPIAHTHTHIHSQRQEMTHTPHIQ